jgi:hypothetical protein
MIVVLPASNGYNIFDAILLFLMFCMDAKIIKAHIVRSLYVLFRFRSDVSTERTFIQTDLKREC